MGNRRFEMHEYRHIITRMRSGDSDRQIAKARLMDCNKAAELRKTAKEHGWLTPGTHLPDDEKLSRVLHRKQGPPKQPSSVDPFTDEVKAWIKQGITNVVIHRALQEKHGFAGSYSAVRRFVRNLRRNEPPETTVMLDYEPGDIAQVDFGAGSTIIDVMTGEIFKTWFFVMTLAWSRHQYVEIVTDQKVLTWLGGHHQSLLA